MRKTTLWKEEVENGVRIAETEVDILCIGRDKKDYLVGECKFKGRPFRYTEYLVAAAKFAPLKRQANFYYALFSENGFEEKLIAESASKEIRLYSLNEIVNYKS